MQTPEERAEIGIKQSLDHANRVEAEWSGQALGMLTAFASHNREPFLIEEARAWAEEHGLPPPPDHRAWGGVVRSAAAKRRIQKAGFGVAKSSNNSPKVMWRKPCSS